MTPDDANHHALIEQARAGDPHQRDALARLIQERVYPYFRRVTLSEDRAEDLTQDTILAVLKSLTALQRTDRFWPWVFTIASNLVRQQFRTAARHRTVPMSSVPEAIVESQAHDRPSAGVGSARTWSHVQDGLAESSARELAALTQQAMSRLSERYRMILALRFYEDLSHAEAAQIMGCTEFNARALFFRAKHAITRELKTLGVRKSALLAAFAAFGHMTLHPSSASAASVSVSSGAATEGVITGLLTAKAKAVAATVLLVAAAGIWTFAFREQAWSGPAQAGVVQPPSQLGRSSQAPENPPASRPAGRLPLYVRAFSSGSNLGAIRSNQAPYEISFYFPEGEGGPFIKQSSPLNEADRSRLTWHVDTLDGSYRVDGPRGEIHICNARDRCNELHTAMLPTDVVEFGEFVHAMDGVNSHALVDKQGFSFERDPGTGFVIGLLDRRSAAAAMPFRIDYRREIPASMLSALPAGLRVIDDRDAMHRRGWAHFRIHGQWAGLALRGVGRVPFTYAASQTHPAWLRLELGERFVLTGEGTGAIVRDREGEIQVSRIGWAFWKGLLRPWEGFHTIDSIRRDAAASRCRFRIRPAGGKNAIIEVFLNPGMPRSRQPAAQAEYLVDMDRDLLLSVRYWRESEPEPICEMIFSYMDDMDAPEGEFLMAPAAGEPAPAETGGPALPVIRDTPLWPVDLIAPLGLEPALP